MGEVLATLFRTLRHTARSLARSPGFALTSVLTLGLGIGACTLIFSVVYPVLVAPLPYPDPHELTTLYEVSPGAHGRSGWVAPPTLEDWRRRSRHFERIASYRLNTFTWTGGPEPTVLNGWAVSADYFPAMGLDMTIGRSFTEEEDQAGGERLVVLSHSLWQQHFGSNPEVLGKTMTLDGEPFTVIGVANPRIDFPSSGGYWVPATLDFSWDARDFRFLGVIARLRNGSTLDEAQSEMNRISREIASENPATNTDWGVEVRGLKENQVGYVRPVLTGMSVAVGLLLLIALGNIANLSVARSVGKRTDAAVRRALGASRASLARLFLAESVVLSLLGGALGTGIAVWGTQAVSDLALASLPRVDAIAVDARCLAFALLTAITVGLALGLLSMRVAARQDLSGTLRAGGAGGMATSAAHRMREGVLAGQVAMALVLLIGATLLARSLFGLARVDVGFTPDDLFTFGYDLPAASYPDPVSQRAFYEDLVTRLEDTPGIRWAGAVTPIPMEMGSVPGSWSLSAEVRDPSSATIMAHMRLATPGYFEVMEIPLLSGRYLDRGDREDTEPVALVNRAFADRYLSGHDPVGVRVSPGEPEPDESNWLRIVGVVGDVRFTSLREEGEPEIYLPMAQLPASWGHLVVKGRGSPREIADAVAAVMRRVDPSLPLSDIRTGSDIIARQLRTSRLSTLLTSLFAVVATGLAAVGILGVLSVVVAQRMREIGLRVVLGAPAGRIWKYTLHRGMRPVVIGMILGIGTAMVATRLLGSQIYGVEALDPLAFLLPTIGFGIAGLLACLIPGARAAAVDPASLLRSE
jgi:putative ABC transport system permease protein